MNIPDCPLQSPALGPDEQQTLLGKLLNTYEDAYGINNIEGSNLPRSQELLAISEKLLEVVFPGYNQQAYKRSEMASVLTKLLSEIECKLFDQIYRALRHSCGGQCAQCQVNAQARTAVRNLLNSLTDLRESMKLDVAAAYVGDPAATSYDEIILSYPCIKAITIQRLAHQLYLDKIPLLPRMLTEHAHSITGIDIHPGAKLGKGVFIDHGTGVVIGETAVLGDNCRIYQGVTLGALSFPKTADGMLVKGIKRHPTIGNDVIIYAGATVLGDITIGDKSVIGGNVWITESLPPGTKITARPPEHMVKTL